MRYILWRENQTQNVAEKLILDLFLKVKIEHIYWSTVWNVMQDFYCMFKFRNYPNISKLWCQPLSLTSYKAFLNRIKWSETSFLTIFSLWIFQKKHFLLKILISKKNVIFYQRTKFHCLIAFIFNLQYVYCNYSFPRLWRHKFLNWPYLCFLTCAKISRHKFKYLKNKMSFLDEIERFGNHF